MHRYPDHALGRYWVHSPLWDGCWLLSGLPIGIVAAGLVLLGVPYFWLLAFGMLVFQTAHSISPIALAWSNTGFRRIMLARPIKFVGVPVAILATWTVAGYIGSFYWPETVFNPVTNKINVGPGIYHCPDIVSCPYWQPLWFMGAIYGYWNIYHFGKQNFGIMSLYRRKIGNCDIDSRGGAGRGDADAFRVSDRTIDLIFCCTMCWATMAVPTVHRIANWLRWDVLRIDNVVIFYITLAVAGAAFMLWRERRRLCLPRMILILTNALGPGTVLIWGIVGFGIISMNHWLTAIGLAARAQGHVIIFSIATMVLGTALFYSLFMHGWEVPTKVAASAVAFRLALGIVHFLYDRWVWKLSDPQVRATIGRELLTA